MPARDSHSTRRQDLLTLLAPVVAALGYDLEDVSVAAAGRRSVVRVIVDADGGIDLDGVADVSRAISVVLDDESGSPAFAGPFVLEVSSPGVDRPLTEPRHWRRAVGRLVRSTFDGAELRGRVMAAGPVSVTVDVDGAPLEVPLDRLGAGRIEVEFSRPGDRTGDIDVDIDIDGDDAPLAVTSARQPGKA